MSSHEFIAELAHERESIAAVAPATAWDWPVRVFHWALVAAFAGAYLTHRLGVEYFKYHAWCGYAVIVLVVFRIGWGFVGTQHARFASFVRGPVTTLRYARDWFDRSQHTAGHNPLGAWMVLLLLLALLTQGVFGLFGNDDILNVGPLFGYVSTEVSSMLTSWHRQLFYWIAAAVAVHVLAVVLHVVVKKHDLIRPMLTGRYEARGVARSTRVHWIAIAMLCASVAALAVVIVTAPAAVLPE